MQEFFTKLTSVIKSHEAVILMTHQNPDLDGMSSSICLYRIIESFEKEVFLYKPSEMINRSVIKMFNKLKEQKYKFKFITEAEIKELNKSKLLIILDVSNEKLTENTKVIDYINDVVVIDHHIKSDQYLKNTSLTYINSNLSSIAELMTRYSKFLNKEPSPILATILLAAIEIDTNSFNLKTTEETYQTAAYLAKSGADNIIKQEMLQENKEKYLQKQDFIKNSYMITNNIALCVLDNEIHEKIDLATISEDLLQFEDVEASITIGRTSSNKVGASARSIGTINVEKIMKKLHGGGHANEAAAEIENTTIEELLHQVINVVKEESNASNIH